MGDWFPCLIKIVVTKKQWKHTWFPKVVYLSVSNRKDREFPVRGQEPKTVFSSIILNSFKNENWCAFDRAVEWSRCFPCWPYFFSTSPFCQMALCNCGVCRAETPPQRQRSSQSLATSYVPLPAIVKFGCLVVGTTRQRKQETAKKILPTGFLRVPFLETDLEEITCGNFKHPNYFFYRCKTWSWNATGHVEETWGANNV